MTYTELLAQKEWNEKCNHILQRDKYRCKDCGKIGYHNDTFYVTDSLDEVDEFLNEKVLMAHPTNPVGRYADANPKLLPNDT